MGDNYDLPSNFDLIIVGTGVAESVVSAAASRIGKRVLHIDKDEFYGGHWASFNLSSFHSLPDVFKSTDIHEENGKDLTCGNDFFNIDNFSSKWNIPEKNVSSEKETILEPCPVEIELAEETSKETLSNADKIQTDENPIIYSQEYLLSESRKFNIDLVPKLNFARGAYVELLISSNIARYSEYRSVSRVLTWINGQLEVVPCSRSDVFANNRVSVIEKRMLMKLLTSLDGDNGVDIKEYENKTFLQFLKEKKLTPNLIHYVLYAISMSDDSTPCSEGIERTKRFLTSLGRFGKTPFLFSMYGSGETAQAFCRLSAVFGGVYALKQPLKCFSVDDNKLSTITCGTQQISADHFVIALQKSPPNYVKNVKKEFIARAVFITDRSIMDSDKEHLTLLMYPPENGRNLVTMFELGCLTGTCPKGFYVVHLISRQKDNPQSDFEHIVQNLFENSFSIENTEVEGKPRILWESYFSLPDTNNSSLDDLELPENVSLCHGPDLDLDYDGTINKAKGIFEKIYPDLEFLPRAPDPEDIIIEGEENKEETGDHIQIGQNNQESERTEELTNKDNAKKPEETEKSE